MEWVETTGTTIEEAKEAALDELGVDASDAEFDVIEEPKSGLFGRLRQEARVRARVRPTTPRAKPERRGRKPRSKESAAEAKTDAEPTRPSPAKRDAPKRSGSKAKAAGQDRPHGRGRAATATPNEVEQAPMSRARTGRTDDMDTEIDEATLAEQGELVKEFLDGLVDAFGTEGSTEITEVDDETIEASVVGDDLGLLIGPKGQTLNAVQELARTMVMKGPGRGARVRVDVGGYRERRKEALERFTRQIATQVLETGTPTALEPMSPADRKVVHDTVNTIDGVSTISEGEDARRRVVVMPEDED